MLKNLAKDSVNSSFKRKLNEKSNLWTNRHGSTSSNPKENDGGQILFTQLSSEKTQPCHDCKNDSLDKTSINHHYKWFFSWFIIIRHLIFKPLLSSSAYTTFTSPLILLHFRKKNFAIQSWWWWSSFLISHRIQPLFHHCYHHQHHHHWIIIFIITTSLLSSK